MTVLSVADVRCALKHRYANHSPLDQRVLELSVAASAALGRKIGHDPLDINVWLSVCAPSERLVLVCALPSVDVRAFCQNVAGAAVERLRRAGSRHADRAADWVEVKAQVALDIAASDLGVAELLNQYADIRAALAGVRAVAEARAKAALRGEVKWRSESERAVGGERRVEVSLIAWGPENIAPGDTFVVNGVSDLHQPCGSVWLTRVGRRGSP